MSDDEDGLGTDILETLSGDIYKRFFISEEKSHILKAEDCAASYSNGITDAFQNVLIRYSNRMKFILMNKIKNLLFIYTNARSNGAPFNGCESGLLVRFILGRAGGEDKAMNEEVVPDEEKAGKERMAEKATYKEQWMNEKLWSDKEQETGEVEQESCGEEQGTGGEEKGEGEDKQGTGGEEKGEGDAEKGEGEQGTGGEEKGEGEDEQGTGGEEKGEGDDEKGEGEDEQGTGGEEQEEGDDEQGKEGEVGHGQREINGLGTFGERWAAFRLAWALGLEMVTKLGLVNGRGRLCEGWNAFRLAWNFGLEMVTNLDLANGLSRFIRLVGANKLLEIKELGDNRLKRMNSLGRTNMPESTNKLRQASERLGIHEPRWITRRLRRFNALGRVNNELGDANAIRQPNGPGCVKEREKINKLLRFRRLRRRFVGGRGGVGERDFDCEQPRFIGERIINGRRFIFLQFGRRAPRGRRLGRLSRGRGANGGGKCKWEADDEDY